jgi:hypothetical protein
MRCLQYPLGQQKGVVARLVAHGAQGALVAVVLEGKQVTGRVEGRILQKKQVKADCRTFWYIGRAAPSQVPATLGGTRNLAAKGKLHARSGTYC